ncbi:AP2-associated protein kinase 1 isoform X1 [Punica granatum]|uniref:non-specific serine/threonine protein kinase n=2 Tax=Punica granatum TaxID=22663 RepID=A0A6P8DYY6_PUNGR|nr:AP2-associated protein kinase 1 isoform X1 [Punica granatum]XP_031400801.1 AP2-associated protein kinase 1 isoform X1 [Punica granatum]XP_031400810.1 AP2-associated protein kinase 1 isoform X1 [Punica granatum]
MWRFKPFMQKEHNGLEGRAVDVGNLKIHIRNAIAEGGFSCVYLARDALHASKQYALKHMICNDEESLELVMKEVSMMKSLKGHPNVVTLLAHTVLDMGRTKEALLVMEFCDKSLVNVLESRGSGYFEEKQILLIFRDVCNAVFAMHCQSPPVAHRDLKAENLLLGSDGLWKLCDFGSASTNHKRFEKPEEMGIEEDNIRKHTTPAYRAPEMWDLYRRELINEKVDIWALGCLLFRICYLKSAFDGESKLQILNGNYRIPELPKYSSLITNLIKDMLQASPDARPDITQVWFRVNEQLPVNFRKSLPDRPPEMLSTDAHEGNAKPANKVSPMPRRSPPPPPSSGEAVKPSQGSRAGGGGVRLGAFWSTQHAKDAAFAEESAGSKFDEDPTSNRTSRLDGSHQDHQNLANKTRPSKDANAQLHPVHRNAPAMSQHRAEGSHPKDFEINFFQKESVGSTERRTASTNESATAFQDEAFNTFVAEFDSKRLSSAMSNNAKSDKEEDLEAEVEKLKEQLKQATLEKGEMTSKYEKLSAICRSQRQEIQELKQALASRTPSPKKDATGNQAPTRVEPSACTVQQQREQIAGTVFQQERFKNRVPSPEPKSWQAFEEDPKPQQPLSRDGASRCVRTRNGHQTKQGAPQVASDFDTWGFGAESFTATPAAAASPQISRPIDGGNLSRRFGESKITESKSDSQPAGWAGF